MSFGVTRKLLEKANLSIADVDLFEVNEAFSSMMVYCVQKLELPMDKLNVNGGAMYVMFSSIVPGGSSSR